MKSFLAKIYHFPKRIVASLGVGFVVTVLVVITQIPTVTNLFAAPAENKAVIPSDIPEAIHVKEDVCEEDITKVEDPGKVKRLVIPAIQMGLPIVSVPMENGTWQVYDEVANFAEGTSPFNGDVGNSVLYGHNKSDAFKPISKLKKGDVVNVQTSKYQFSYEVTEVTTTVPTNIDIMKPGEDRQLTLLTCNGLFDEKRLAVKAKLVKITQLNCSEGGN